jgi:nicotinamidase-related amidase
MTTDRTLHLDGRYYRLYPSFAAPFGHATDPLGFPVANTAFLLVDVYGLGFDDDSVEVPSIYAVDETTRQMVRDRIRPAKDAARQVGLPTIYLTNHLSPGLDEGNEWRNMSLRTCDVDVLQAWKEPNSILAFSKIIAPDDHDVVIAKQMYSGFFETTLHSTLTNRNIRNLVVVGFDSRICLGNTLSDALYRNYRIVVLRDCVRTFEYPETADGQWANFIAIRYIESNIGFTSTSADFVEACQRLLADSA